MSLYDINALLNKVAKLNVFMQTMYNTHTTHTNTHTTHTNTHTSHTNTHTSHTNTHTTHTNTHTTHTNTHNTHKHTHITHKHTHMFTRMYRLQYSNTCTTSGKTTKISPVAATKRKLTLQSPNLRPKCDSFRQLPEMQTFGPNKKRKEKNSACQDLRRLPRRRRE